MNEIIMIPVMILGAVYVLVLPGLALSFALFHRREIDVIERAALSFALSIAVVPLVAFYLNLIGVPLNRLTVIAEVLGIIVLGAVIAWWRSSRVQGPQPEPPVTKVEPPVKVPTPPKPTPKRPARRMGL